MISLPIALVLVIALGMIAQWAAWRSHLPSILLLLLFGVGAGRFFQPDDLVGTDVVSAFVSLSVATILLEGGLSLRLSEIRETRRAVVRLCSLGVLLAWALTTVAAHWIAGLDGRLAALLGALLVVTGPTVITPLLRQIRPVRSVGAVARWEGIVVDPIGAVLAVLVFQAVLAAGRGDAALKVVLAVVVTLLVGALGGYLVARAMELLFKRHWIPDFLHSPMLLMVGLGAYVLANKIQPEVGLLTVTVLGITLANQRSVSLAHVLEFKETLRVLLISSLFIVLAARLDLSSLRTSGGPGIAFVAALILVVRPLSVMLSTVASGLNWQQRLFLSFLAPRGIVAAAVTSVFAIEVMEAVEHGLLPESLLHDARMLEPLAYMVIIGTVAIYGLLAGPLARRLRLAVANPQGILFLGANTWVIEAARELKAAGLDVLLIDTSSENIARARMEKLPALRANILSRYVSEELELFGIGRLIATTPNFEVNTLACQEFIHQFGRENVYQLRFRPAASEKQDLSHRMPGRPLFAERATQKLVQQWLENGARVKRTTLTEKYPYQEFLSRYGEDAIVLFILNGSDRCRVLTEPPQDPQPGTRLISLVREKGTPAPSEKS
jgi:NhaP-type Na+/H+ or K+/H+ antiporter